MLLALAILLATIMAVRAVPTAITAAITLSMRAGSRARTDWITGAIPPIAFAYPPPSGSRANAAKDFSMQNSQDEGGT
jgi:hypothetical protein